MWSTSAERYRKTRTRVRAGSRLGGSRQDAPARAPKQAVGVCSCLHMCNDGIESLRLRSREYGDARSHLGGFVLAEHPGRSIPEVPDMRTRIALLLLLLPLVAWSQEPDSPEPPDPTAHRHRGFHFHLQSGAGYFYSGNETGSASGLNIPVALSLGGAIVEN